MRYTMTWERLTRTFGCDEGYHKKSRPFVDGFITINSNIANYYLRTYAFKDPVIILNACDAIKVEILTRC